MEGVFRFKSWFLNAPGLIHGGAYYRNFPVCLLRLAVKVGQFRMSIAESLSTTVICSHYYSCCAPLQGLDRSTVYLTATSPNRAAIFYNWTY